MAGRKEYEMLFQLNAQLGGSYSKTFKAAQQEIVSMQKEIQALSKTQADISAFQKQQAAVEATRKRLEMLRDAMLFPQEWFVHVRNGKGGRERLSPIIGKNAAQIVERIADTPAEEKVWQHIHTSADIHAYRA